MVSSLTYFEPNVLQTNKHAEVKIRTAQTEASLLKFTEDTIILPRSLSAPALALWWLTLSDGRGKLKQVTVAKHWLILSNVSIIEACFASAFCNKKTAK